MNRSFRISKRAHMRPSSPAPYQEVARPSRFFSSARRTDYSVEAARTAFRSALRWEPLETDLLSVAMVVERALSDQASAEVIDEQLLDRCAELLLRQEQAGAFVLRSFLSWCFFHEFDAEFEKGRRP